MSERSLPFDKLSVVGETNSDANVLILLDDMNGANLVSCSATASIPSGKAGYNKGCILINSANGTIYVNGGSVTSCSFSQVTGTGSSGASGASGATGATGTSGATGATGTSGTSGASGSSGKSGTSGA
jgi:uracil-DNA glycosylase